MSFSAKQAVEIQRIVPGSIAAALAVHADSQPEKVDQPSPGSSGRPTGTCMPCIAHIPTEVVAKTEHDEYVDLATLLLHQTEEPAPKRFSLDEDFSVCLPPKRKIENLQTWLEAWSLFSLVAVNEFPQSAAEFLRHQLCIVQAAGKYWFSAVMSCGVQICQALAGEIRRSLGNT